MLGLPLWLGLSLVGLLVITLLLVWVVYVHRAFRSDVRRRFRLHLETRHPDLRILEETPISLRLQGKEGEPATLFLRRLYGAAAHIDLEDHAAVRELFELWVGVIREGISGQERGPEEDRQRLMPRLVSAAFLKGVSLPADGHLPNRLLDGLGLHVIFVLDGTHSVSFVNDDTLARLHLTAEEAMDLALDNLRRRGGDISVAEVLEGQIQLIQSEDTYAAARLLLVPELLTPGQLVVALIPDRDTLVLAPMPPDGDWTHLRKMARINAGEALLDRPVKVSREGFHAV